MTYYYPYRSSLKTTLSKLRKELDYEVWQHGLKELIAKVKAPIIEIGGPSEDGYYFLDNVSLPSQPIITNISDNPLPFAQDSKGLAEQVQQIMDGRDMPFADDSVGMFLMTCMSISDDWWVWLDNDAKEKAEPKFTAEYLKARLEMGQVAAGMLEPRAAKYAQRVQIYCEVYRTLSKDGLFFTDGAVEEIVILQKLGFELVASVAYIDDSQPPGVRYEFVVKKQ